MTPSESLCVLRVSMYSTDIRGEGGCMVVTTQTGSGKIIVRLCTQIVIHRLMCVFNTWSAASGAIKGDNGNLKRLD